MAAMIILLPAIAAVVAVLAVKTAYFLSHFAH
jgi:hypothetical protein